MTSVLAHYQHESRRRSRRRSSVKHTRLDIQGLRMVAVLTVFANHLCTWPRGGFVGVDVFFVISGFLITGNLLRAADSGQDGFFKGFYWNRVRRIVPAATLVLILTYAASVAVFLPFRSNQVGIDALFAFVFMSNWRFASEGTDYFNAAAASVSPLQHYWSLSIEEQFYLVWPALIFAIGVLVVRKQWTRRVWLAGGVMATIVVASFAWAVWETSTNPIWAYFNTFARVWELGVGALLAIAAGSLAKIPTALKPWMSWAGLGLILVSLFLISADSTTFPAPLAALPVAGAALVISAGVGSEPKYQVFLRNPVSTYIGNISYSLYLVHWPVIVFLGALMAPSANYFVAVLAMSFALAVTSYHLVETPLRKADLKKFRKFKRAIRKGSYRPQKSSQYATVGALALLAIAAGGYILRPVETSAIAQTTNTAAVANSSNPAPLPDLPPLADALDKEIVTALQATEWPQFEPPAEAVITGPKVTPEVGRCKSEPVPAQDKCTWGSPNAETRIVIVGDSLAMGYAGPLRDIALNSNGHIQVHMESTPGCTFVDGPIVGVGQPWMDSCPAAKHEAIDVINMLKPNVVIVSNSYTTKHVESSSTELSTKDWRDAMRTFVQQFNAGEHKIVFMSPPPIDKKIGDCYGIRSRTPADCISKITPRWSAMGQAEQQLAQSIGGTWIDSQTWFCGNQRRCPSFVGDIITKTDEVHMTPTYGQRITPVIAESLHAAGVI